MDVVESLDDTAVPISKACAVLGLSRATLYRHTSPPRPPSYRERRPSPRRLSADERQTVVNTLNSQLFVDQPPREVFATLLTGGIYLASIRTMYRILAERGESSERRRQRPAQTHTKPSVSATAPNQVWTWDITKLATSQPRVFLSLYVIIDLFSRYVVGWMVAAKESKELATQLFAETIARHSVEPGQLTVHADRGSPMRSQTLAQLFANLGVDRSFNRPRVSNDNPFSEAQFKTLKYQPDYPGRFDGLTHARGWLQTFFGWHNDRHHHTGLALFTPADVFHGRVTEVARKRQRALDHAYKTTPQRFVKGRPLVRRPPDTVAINPLQHHALDLDGGRLPPDSEVSTAPLTSPTVQSTSTRRSQVPRQSKPS